MNAATLKLVAETREAKERELLFLQAQRDGLQRDMDDIDARIGALAAQVAAYGEDLAAVAEADLAAELA